MCENLNKKCEKIQNKTDNNMSNNITEEELEYEPKHK